ncbi:chymotrypsin-2-like [Nasonia vitripennis]|uniref:Peptidase S1 domain-containing protein n=1 Tax=Nasonia vitripennis TaxID=7425 RepID=A0A7M7LVA9_NASVI|nr:chymotrypsin-2-like [Nasonia vitripennis]
MSRVQFVFLLVALPAVFAQIYYPDYPGYNIPGDCNTNVNGIPISTGSGGCNININGNRRNMNNNYRQEVGLPYEANINVIRSGIPENCKGSVLHKRWILTAASCIDQLGYPASVSVSPITSPNVGSPYGYEKLFVHPNYTPGLPANDIGLIRLNRDIDVRVSQIQMAPSSYESVPGTIATVSENEQKADFVIISEQECRNQLNNVLTEVQGSAKETRFYQNAISNINTLVCANPSSDVTRCGGDRGSPLVSSGMQIGIVEGSQTCNGFPGLYTKVSKFSEWVNQEMLRYPDYFSLQVN